MWLPIIERQPLILMTNSQSFRVLVIKVALHMDIFRSYFGCQAVTCWCCVIDAERIKAPGTRGVVRLFQNKKS